MSEKKAFRKYYAGLDIAKNKINVCIIDSSDFRLDEEYDTTLDGLMSLKNNLKKHLVEEVIYENTGVYSVPVMNILKDEFKIFPVHPADVKRKNQKKTDVSDAWWLANLLRSGTIGKDKGIESSYIPSKKQSELRILTRMQSRYTAQTTKHKNRITKIFDRSNIKIMTLFDNDKFTKTSLAVYQTLAEKKSWTDKIVELEENKIGKKGRESNIITRQIKFLTNNEEELNFLVKNSTQGKLTENNRLELLFELIQLEQLFDIIDILEKKIEEIISKEKEFKEQVDLLMSIPGMGKTTAPQIVAEIPPIENFQTAKKFASFAGLVPKVQRSADVVHIGKITKRGSSYLRKALFQAGQVASMSTKQSLGRKAKLLFERKGKGKGKIVWTALARCLAEISFIILRSKRPYEEPGYSKRAVKKAKRILNTQTVHEIAKELRNRNYQVVIKDLSTDIAF